MSRYHPAPTAQVLQVAETTAIAVEHPMIVMNVDKALSTFGRHRTFNGILSADHPDECIPLYLRPQDPMDVPILSHNCRTNNLLLKLTVPRRTGRKRKRGSQGLYVEDSLAVSSTASKSQSLDDEVDDIQSVARQDDPVELLGKLKENVERYEVEIIAKIKRTHRFRGLSDFQQSTSNTPFLSKFRDTALTGYVDGLRAFNLDPGQGWKSNEDILPPPAFTTQSLPYIWAWRQNPVNTVEFDEATENPVTTIPTRKSRKRDLEYIVSNIPTVPQAGPEEPHDDLVLLDLVSALREAFDERPVWTRRALVNRVASHPYVYRVMEAFQYVGYQFKAGPFRDALIKFGVDPRTDKAYRLYQTVVFQIHEEEEKTPGMQWQDARTGFIVSKQVNNRDNRTHLFDGKTLTLDGKIWQLCDVTDPFLIKVIASLTLRDEFDFKHDGWFCNGAWAKLRAIMKTKLLAIRTGKVLRDEDFSTTLAFPDHQPGRFSSYLSTSVPVPDMKLTNEEIEQLRDEGKLNTIGGGAIRKREIKRDSGKYASTVEPVVKKRGRGRPKKVRDVELDGYT